MKVNTILAAILTLGSFAALADYDITAYLRGLPSGMANMKVSVTGKAVALTTPADTISMAVDGDITTDAGRPLFHRGGPSSTIRENGFIVDLDPVDHPGETFRVNAFRVYRINPSSYTPNKRMTREFSLEGSNDGTNWSPLYTTPDKQTWDDSTLVRTYEIPVERRAVYRYYRFMILADYNDTTVDASYVGLQELALIGESDRPLVWNGGAGATWNGADANWLSGAAATAWESGAQAVFGEGGTKEVPVGGAQATHGLVFRGGQATTLAGGTVQLQDSGTIWVDQGVIGSALELTASSWQGDHVGWLPADPAKTTQGTSVCVWKNRNLADITDFPEATVYFSKKEYAGRAYNIQNLGISATAQFQVMPDALICVKVQFDQVGRDIYAKAVYAKFSWDGARALGDDFDPSKNNSNVYDADISTSGYGVKDIVASGDPDPIAPSLAIRFQPASESVLGTAYLPRSANPDTPHVGEPVVYWRNRQLKDLMRIDGGVLCTSGSLRNPEIGFLTNDGETATVQFQARSGSAGDGARICAKVRFTQSGDDILAVLEYVKYNWAHLDFHSFDDESLDARIWVYDDAHTVLDPDSSKQIGAYGVKEIKALFRGQLTVTGALPAEGDVNVGANGVFTLGMGSFAYDRNFTGGGTIRFAPVGTASQAVAVTGARTLEAAAFGGATTFSFADGASLAIAAAEVEDAAAVSLVGALGEHSLRIGTGKTLSKEALAKFMYNGHPARQTDDGYILPKPGLMIIVQ